MTTAKELVEKMPGVFKADKAGDLNATIQLDLAGDGGGIWAVRIANGSCDLVEGGVDSPTMTISMDAADFVAMQRGELQPMAAFMQGKIKLQGDMGLAMKFQELFN